MMKSTHEQKGEKHTGSIHEMVSGKKPDEVSKSFTVESHSTIMEYFGK